VRQVGHKEEEKGVAEKVRRRQVKNEKEAARSESRKKRSGDRTETRKRGEWRKERARASRYKCVRVGATDRISLVRYAPARPIPTYNALENGATGSVTPKPEIHRSKGGIGKAKLVPNFPGCAEVSFRILERVRSRRSATLNNCRDFFPYREC